MHGAGRMSFRYRCCAYVHIVMCVCVIQEWLLVIDMRERCGWFSSRYVYEGERMEIHMCKLVDVGLSMSCTSQKVDILNLLIILKSSKSLPEVRGICRLLVCEPPRAQLRRT